MPKAFPLEFRRDVVAVARRREAPLCRIAKDFGVSEACLHRWLKMADVEDRLRPGITQAEVAEMRELKKQPPTRAGERGASPSGCVSRPRSEPKMSYPLIRDLAADEIPVVVTCRVLRFSPQAFYKCGIATR